MEYCLKREDDPRPALTAAAACTNMIHLMFADLRNDVRQYTVKQMREQLEKLDQCIARYDQIASQWDESKKWDRLSPDRVNECEERVFLNRNIRRAAEATISRLERESKESQLAN